MWWQLLGWGSQFGLKSNQCGNVTYTTMKKCPLIFIKKKKNPGELGGFRICFSKMMNLMEYKVSNKWPDYIITLFMEVPPSIWTVRTVFHPEGTWPKGAKGNWLKTSCCVPIVHGKCKAQQQYLKGRSSDRHFGTQCLFTSQYLMRHFYFPLTLKVTFFSLMQRNHVMLLPSRFRIVFFFTVSVFKNVVGNQMCSCLFDQFIWRRPTSSSYFVILWICLQLHQNPFQYFGVFLVQKINKCSASIFRPFFLLHTNLNISPQIVINTSLHSHT